MPSSPALAGSAAPADLRPALRKVAAGQTLTESEAAEAFETIMSGGATEAQIGALLMGMRARRETVDEITGAANNFRWNESPLDLLNRFSHASETVPSFSREWGDDYFSRTATPALRVPDFNMSSVSQAQ